MNALVPTCDLDPRSQPLREEWQGFAEVDEALRENRLMQYRLRKSWADPWGRKLTIAGVLVIVAVFAYLIGSSLRLF